MHNIIHICSIKRILSSTQTHQSWLWLQMQMVNQQIREVGAAISSHPARADQQAELVTQSTPVRLALCALRTSKQVLQNRQSWLAPNLPLAPRLSAVPLIGFPPPPPAARIGSLDVTLTCSDTYSSFTPASPVQHAASTSPPLHHPVPIRPIRTSFTTHSPHHRPVNSVEQLRLVASLPIGKSISQIAQQPLDSVTRGG